MLTTSSLAGIAHRDGPNIEGRVPVISCKLKRYLPQRLTACWEALFYHPPEFKFGVKGSAVSVTDRFSGNEGQELAQQILAVMSRHNVPPSPHNYALWTAYVTGSHPTVAASLDELVRTGSLITEAICEKLYNDNLRSLEPSSDLLSASDTLDVSVREAQQSLATAKDETRAYGVVLKNARGQLEASDGANIQDLISHLLTETNNMRQRTAELEQSLSESTGKVEVLRKQLTDARQEALTDPLTGLANRKQMEIQLRQLIAATQTTGEPTSVVIADIDHFKRVNDTWGHPTGDQVIRFVARTMRRLAGDDDVIARYGGEEFVVLVPGCTVDETVRFAESVRRAVEAKQLLRKSTNEILGNVTISMGVAAIQPGDEPGDILDRADKRLYCSKQNGRNRVTFEDPADNGQPAAA